MVPRTGTTKGGNDPESMTDVQRQHWDSVFDELMEGQENLPDDHYLKLANNQFNFAGQQVDDPREWFKQVLDTYNTPEGQDPQGMGERDGQPFDERMSKANINFLLRNLQLMQMFNNESQKGDGSDKKLFENLMFGSSKINYRDEDEFLPFLKVYG